MAIRPTAASRTPSARRHHFPPIRLVDGPPDGIAITKNCRKAHFGTIQHSRSEMDHIFWFLVDFGGIALFGIAIGAQRYSCAERMETFIHLVRTLVKSVTL